MVMKTEFLSRRFLFQKQSSFVSRMFLVKHFKSITLPKAITCPKLQHLCHSVSSFLTITRLRLVWQSLVATEILDPCGVLTSPIRAKIV